MTITGTGFEKGLGYRTTISLNNPNATTLTDYQVRVTFDSQSLISAGKMRTDCGDIRFRASNSVTELPYYLESGCNTTTTIAWVKVNSMPAGSSNIYMYHGRLAQTSASSGSDVFIFFDNFETGANGDRVDATKWPTLSSSASLSGDAWIKSTATVNEGSLSGSNNTMSGQDSVYREMTSQTFTIPAGTSATVDFNWTVSSENTFDYVFYCISQVAAPATPADPACTRTAGFINRISGTTGWTREFSTSTLFTGGNIGKIKFRYEKDGSLSGGSDTGWIDSVKVRKYTAAEPSATIGSEITTGIDTNYSQIINITSGAALSNYPVRLVFNTQSLISAKKMNSDCSDIRFKARDLVTDLSYYLESGCNSSSTVVWVKVDSLSLGTTPIYMYYGKYDLSSASFGSNVFIFFDDFEGGASGDRVSASKWESLVSSGTLTGDAWVKTDTSSYEGSLVGSNNSMSGQDSVYREMITPTIAIPAGASAVVDFNWRTESEVDFDYLFYCTSTSASTPATPGCTRTLGYTNRISGSTAWARENPTASPIPAGVNMKLKFRYEKDGSVSSGQDRGWIDSVKIRPYISPEPSPSFDVETRNSTTIGFGTNNAQSINSSSTEIFAITPASTTGIGAVTVTATAPDGFVYSLVPGYTYTYVIPSAPTLLNASNAGSSEVSLSWTAPTDDGGQSITDYVIQYRNFPAGSFQTYNDGTSTSTSALVSGLTNNQEYEFQVAAVNSVGQSPYSNTSTATPEATYTTPVVSSPGFNIGIAEVELSGDTILLENQSPTPNTAPSYTYFNTAPQPDLTEETAYQLFVFAGPNYNQVLSAWIDYNSDGDFIDSGELIANNISHALNTTATVNFTTPNISGGITGGVKRLRVGSEYYSYNIDSAGNGPNTYGEYEDYNILLQSSPLSAPQNLVVQNSVPEEVTLNWDMPVNDGGYPLDDYIIKYGPNGEACDPTNFNDIDCFTASAPHSPTNPQSVTISGLDTFYQYSFAVFSTNANGDNSDTSSNVVAAPPTTVFNVNPNTVVNGGVRNLFIEGTYIFSGPTPAPSTVDLVRGTTVIPCSVYNEITSTNFDCDFDLTSAPPGVYSIRVNNFDGNTATFSNALTITPGPMTITNVSPAYGTTNGGTTVTISGSNFAPTYYQVPYAIGTFPQVTPNYQVSLTLDTQTPISEGKMRSDCGDIRIKDQSGTTDLDFWFEGPCNSPTSVIWVEMPNIDNIASTTINATYGNLSLTSASNANNTFLDLITGLQANWPYDEITGDNIGDFSGNNNDATFFSGGWIDWGLYGFTRLFSGGNYGDAGNPNSLNIDGAGAQLTLETWVKMVTETNGNYPRLISKLSCTPYNGYELLIGAPDATASLSQKPYLQLGNGGSLSTISANTTITPDGNWHHIVATYDGTAAAFDMAKIYVDGALSINSNTISSSTAIGASSANVQLAQWPCAGGNFQGYLDETRIYNSALTAEEITNIYNNRSFSSTSLPNTLLVRKSNTFGYEPSVTASGEQGKGLQVNFGAAAATNVYSTSDTTIIATTPAHSEGQTNVTVINGNSDSQTLTSGFTYFDNRLKVTAINGGNPVVVNEPFSVTVQAVESDNATPYLVESDTDFILNLETGSGYLNQSLGTITTGTSEVTVNNYYYSQTENGVVLSTEDITSGNPLHLQLNSTSTAPFNVVTGPPAANPNSTVDTNFSVRLANGIETARITVMLRESDNSPAHDKTVSLGVVGNPANGPVITPSYCPSEVGGLNGITDGNGCTAFIISSIYTGTFTFEATSVSDSVVITDTADITFTGPTVAASTLTADRTNALANNQSPIIVTATVSDSGGNVFAYRPVTLQRTDSNPAITTVTAIACPGEVSPTPGTTNINGHACFSITSNSAGTYSFQAQNSIENQTFPVTPLSLTFGDGLVWGATAQPIANAINDTSTYRTTQFQQVINSSDNNYIVVWADDRNSNGSGGELTLMAQKFSPTGAPLWTSGANYDDNGIVVFDAGSNSDAETNNSEIYWPRVVSDNNGGAIITWYLHRNSSVEDAKLVGKRLDYNGGNLWATTPFTTLVNHLHNNGSDYAPQYDVIADSIEGIFITYREYTGTTYWNGSYYYHHRYVDHIGPGGTRVTGEVETWPVLVSATPSCDNNWGELLLADQSPDPNVVRLVYDRLISGACIGDNDKQAPLHVVTLNNSNPNDELKATIVTTDMMDNYIGNEPYDTEHGYGYTNGCDGRYAYEQGQPVIMSDADGGIYVAYTEICHGDAFTYGYDAQIVVEHIPDIGFIPDAGSRIIGQCPYNSCSFALNGMDVFGTSDGSIDEFFMAWNDRYDNGGQSVQRYITNSIAGYSVPMPFWDSNPLTTYKDPLPLDFKAITHAQGNGVYVINNLPFSGDESNLPRIRAMLIDQSGSPYLDNTTLNGWTPTGNQISSFPTSPNITGDSPLNFMNYFIEYLTPNTDYLDKVTADSSGNLISTFYRTGHPIYNATSTDGFIQKMIVSSALPAFESGGQPSEVQIDPNIDSTSTQEQNQSSSRGAKLNNGETVYAWVDGLDKYNGIAMPPQIRAEKFDEDGDPQWNTLNPPGRSFGIAIHNVEEDYSGDFISPVVVADLINDVKTGNSLIAFADSGLGSKCIFLQKLEGDGTPFDADNNGNYDWDINGEASQLYCSSSEFSNLAMASDDNGGAFISVQEDDGTIIVMHIYSASGTVDWTTTLAPSGGESRSDYNQIIFDGSVYLIWETNNTTSSTNIRMARLNATTGSIELTPNFNLPGVQANPDVIVNPGDGSIILAYHHFDLPSSGQPGENYIAVQKYDANLTPQWPTSASPSLIELNNITFTGPAPSTARTNTNPKISYRDAAFVGDESIIIVSWSFENADYFPLSVNNSQIKSARLNFQTGDMIWGVSTNSEDDNVFWERGVQVQSDGSVGAMASWIKYDSNTGETYVFIQHIINGLNQIANYGLDLSGTIQPIFLLNSTGRPLEQILGDNAFSATVSWLQVDNGGFFDIFGQAYVDTKHSFNSTLETSTLSVPADGVTGIEVMLTLLDSADAILINKDVSLAVIYGNAASVTITPQPVCDGGPALAGTTNNQGKACWTVTSTTPGLIRVAAYNTTEANTVIEPYAELTFSELPTSPTLSTFVANPTTVYNDGSSTSLLTLTLRNTNNLPQPEKTASIVHDGTNININTVLCPGSSNTNINVTDIDGQICYEVSSTDAQIVTFTATETGDSIEINQTPEVTFEPPAISGSLSTIQLMSGESIDPIDPTYHNYDLYNPNNAALIKVTVRNILNNIVVGETVNLTATPSLNTIIRGVSCYNPRTYSGTASSNSDDLGTACFLVYSSTPIELEEIPISLQASISNSPDPDTIVTSGTVEIDLFPHANSFINNFRFRNDDGNELTATPISSINTPFYNAVNNQAFRLRIGMNRSFPQGDASMILDEFSPTANVNIGPRPLPIPVDLESYRAFPGLAIDESTNLLYVPTADLTPSAPRVRFYVYDLDNLSAAPTSFDLPSGPIDDSLPYNDRLDAPISGFTHAITNTFIDSTNQLMYFVSTPYFSNFTSDVIRVYKVNLVTQQLVDVLTEELDYSPNSRDFYRDAFDSEIDLANNLLYLAITDDSAKIMKIKLNAPTAAMTKVGLLTLDNTGLPITSSLIDSTNQYLYVTTGEPQKIFKIDLNVDANQIPASVDQIYLVPSTSSSPAETVGYQASVLDPIEGYAYFVSSSDGTSGSFDGTQRAYVTKVDIDPNRAFEVIARLSLVDPLGTSADSYYYGEYNFGTPGDRNNLVIATPAIDVIDHYLYIPIGHLNTPRNSIFRKLMRIKTDDLSMQNIELNEVPYAYTDFMNFKGHILSPREDRGYFIRQLVDGDVLTEYNSTTKWNFTLQSSPNVNGGYCNYASLGSYNWTSLPNSDFTLENSTHYNDGDPSTNVTGLLSDDNESFVPGQLKDSSIATSTINLGRSEFTEIEYTLKPTAGAQGSYCLRVIDADPNHNNQVSGYPNLITGRVGVDLSPTTDNHFIPITVGGLILDRTSVNIIEGTTTDSYGIKLSSIPSSNVTVTINADDNRIILSPDPTPATTTETTLTFTTANWDTYQYVTVSSNNNSTVDGTTTELINHTVTSSDPGYNNIITQPVTSVVTDYGSSSTNVIATVTGQATFTPPANFTFPEITLGTTSPNFSPALPLLFSDDRGITFDYTLTMQATNFCKSVGVCIPLNKVFLATSNLNNLYNTFNAAEVGQFLANYLQGGESLSDRGTYVHANPAEDRTLSTPVTIIDTRNVPSGSTDNPLQGSLSSNLNLMIDYGNITSVLEAGTYLTTLVFDFNTNP